MFEGVRARLERLLREYSRSDPRGYAAGVREAVLEAKVGVSAMRDGLASTERELETERTQLVDAERRGRLASEVPDAETVAVAERYAARHRERLVVLERKLEVQREELALAEREVAEMIAEYRSARGDVGRTRSRRPGATSNPPAASGPGRLERTIDSESRAIASSKSRR